MFDMLTPEQYRQYYRAMEKLASAGVQYFGRTEYGSKIYVYNDAYLTLDSNYISEDRWVFEAFMTLVERNAKVGDLYLVAGQELEFPDDELDVDELLEIIEETIDNPPHFMTEPLSDDYFEPWEDDEEDADDDEDKTRSEDIEEEEQEEE